MQERDATLNRVVWESLSKGRESEPCRQLRDYHLKERETSMYKGLEAATYLTCLRNSKKATFTGPMCGKEKNV